MAGDPSADQLLKSFLDDVRDDVRDAEVERILSCFRLNPFEHLNLRFDATDADVTRAYRHISLMVHPDKCKHERAKEAFEVLGSARKMLLDEQKRKDLTASLNFVKGELIREWKKNHKKDAGTRLLAQATGKSAEDTFAESDAFRELWKQKVRETLGTREWRKRKLSIRMGEEEKRVNEDEAEKRKEFKAVKKERDQWDKRRDNRVGNWRDFVSSKKKKSKSNVLGAGIKVPTMRAHDPEKDYIRRPPPS